MTGGLTGWLRSWRYGTRDLRWTLRQVRYGYTHRIVGTTRLSMADLRVRKEPTVVLAPGRQRPWTDPPLRVVQNPVDRFFPLVGGREDRRLIHLPHMRLLEHHDRHGSLPPDPDYARLLRVRALIQGRELPEGAVRAKMSRLLATHASIRDRGYRGPGHRRDWLVVMEESVHPPTATYAPQGFEIFDGHHRAVVLAHLGVDTVEVLMTRAVRHGDFDWTAEPWDQRLWEQAGPPGREPG